MIGAPHFQAKPCGALSRLGLVVRSSREDLQIGKKLWLSIRVFVGGSINGVPLNGWFIMENPIKMGDLGIPPFIETSMCLQSNKQFG